MAYFAHETAIIDDVCHIGEGTKNLAFFAPNVKLCLRFKL